MENKMDCENYEEKILEVLDGEKFSQEILYHIDKCQSCSDFYGYITALKKDLGQMEKLEPSADFNAKVIEKLKQEPAYFRVLAFINCFAIFISLLSVFFIVKRYFTDIAVFCVKTLKVAEILSEALPHGFYTFAILSFLSVMFLVIFSGAFDIFLLSKLIKNGREL
jgi:hypothetical protein